MINKILEKFREKFFFLDNLKVTYFHGDSVKQAKKLEHLCKTVTKDMEDFLRQSIVEVLEDVKRKIKSFKIMDGSVIDKLDEDTERARITNNLNENLEIGYRQACLDILSTITSEIESNK